MRSDEISVLMDLLLEQLGPHRIEVRPCAVLCHFRYEEQCYGLLLEADRHGCFSACEGTLTAKDSGLSLYGLWGAPMQIIAHVKRRLGRARRAA